MIRTGKKSETASSRFSKILHFLPFSLLPLINACSGLFYYPDRGLHYPPEKLGYTPREVHFASSDGTKLFAWYFPGKTAGKTAEKYAEKSAAANKHGLGARPKGTIIQFHGNAENISSHYLSLVWLADRGYNLFTFDYRGYGRSEGEPNQQGTYLDGLAALGTAWKHHLESAGSDAPFVVVGQSLGGAIAARALADFEHRDETALLVMDSTFVSYKDVARRKLAGHWVSWPLSPLPMMLVSDSFSATDSIRALKIPLLVIHDREDPAVPYEGAVEFHGQAESACWKDFWVLDQGRHIGVFAIDNVPWRQKFVSLLGSLPIRGPGCGNPPVSSL